MRNEREVYNIINLGTVSANYPSYGLPGKWPPSAAAHQCPENTVGLLVLTRTSTKLILSIPARKITRNCVQDAGSVCTDFSDSEIVKVEVDPICPSLAVQLPPCISLQLLFLNCWQKWLPAEVSVRSLCFMHLEVGVFVTEQLWAKGNLFLCEIEIRLFKIKKMFQGSEGVSVTYRHLCKEFTETRPW